jgi:hypothetical protein
MSILQAERNRHRDEGNGRREMNAANAGAASAVIPTFRYHDAPAAIDWLCRVLGFEAHLIVPGETDGIVAHAQLTLGNGMIMLGSALRRIS